jgi:hypothetical protein
MPVHAIELTEGSTCGACDKPSHHERPYRFSLEPLARLLSVPLGLWARWLQLGEPSLWSGHGEGARTRERLPPFGASAWGRFSLPDIGTPPSGQLRQGYSRSLGGESAGEAFGT